MSYLVDGNNVMGQRVGWHRDKPRARRRLLEELARFAKSAGTRVSVVFDGAPDEHFPDGASFMGVEVFYAERGSNADERIKQLVEREPQRRTLRVVTSDRALGDYVRRTGACVIRSGDFRRRIDELEERQRRREQQERRRDDGETMPEEELLREMRYFGVAPEDDETGG